MKNLSAEFLGNAVRVRCEPDTYARYNEWEKAQRHVRAIGLGIFPPIDTSEIMCIDLVSFIKTAPYDLLCWVMLGILPKSVRWDIGLLRNAAATRRDTAEREARRIKQEARKAAIKAFDAYRKQNKLDFDDPLAVQAAEIQNAALDQANSDYEAACEAIDQGWEENIRADYLSLITDTVRYTD